MLWWFDERFIPRQVVNVNQALAPFDSAALDLSAAAAAAGAALASAACFALSSASSAAVSVMGVRNARYVSELTS